MRNPLCRNGFRAKRRFEARQYLPLTTAFAGRRIGRAPVWVGRLECAALDCAGRRIGKSPAGREDWNVSCWAMQGGIALGKRPAWIAQGGVSGNRPSGWEDWNVPRRIAPGGVVLRKRPAWIAQGGVSGNRPSGWEDWNVLCWIAQGGASGERPSVRGDWNVSCWAMQGGVALESACSGSRRAALYRENACTGEEIEMCWGGSGGCTMC